MQLFKTATYAFTLSFALLLTACADVGDAPVADTTEVHSDSIANTLFTGQPLAVDTVTSSIDWWAAKVTRSHDGGFSNFTGNVYVDNDAVAGVEITIDAASIFSDTDRLTGHLKSEDFFEVDVYPEASFAASSFEAIANDSTATHSVTGELTIRDHTNRISFPANISVTSDSVNADADFIIDRQQWGLTYPGAPDDLIQDEVRIFLNVGIARGTATE